jgi:type IV pilus assembly protein PilY1
MIEGVKNMTGISILRQIRNTLTVALTLALVGISAPSYAAVNPVTNTQFSSIPVISTPSAPPLVLLGMSVDNQLFRKAYTDYTDLDSDGTLDTTYTDSFDYYGYFNSGFCYTYASGVYSPDGAVDTGTHQCTGATGNWSGNFLNWASMTRMDVVRKVLYGGKRSSDTTSETILERALIPDDTHAFVKVFDSTDVSKYTPFTPASGKISICNVTDYVSGASDRSKDLNTANNPPLMKVVNGAWPQWSSSEVVQCQYSGGIDRPVVGDRLGGQDHIVRVKACVAGQDISATYCKDYAGGAVSAKPIGLLQRYGDDGTLRFGLVTGSYNKNAEGGVLRKTIKLMTGNTSSADDEIKLADGTFDNQASSDVGIINTLNRIRIAGWDYGSNIYYDCDTYSISISTFKSSGLSNRQCRDWGNPLSEIYLEALRYLKGQSAATTAFDTDDSSNIAGLNQVAWDDPMSVNEHCANCSIVLLSTGLNSFDTDNLGSGSDLPAATVSISGSSVTLNPSNIPAITNLLGSKEGITGGSYIVGNVPGNSTGSCTSKTVAGLGDATGLCPEIPQMEGSYNVAGLAYYAKLADLRTATGYPGTQNVDTFTVGLAESLPSFEIASSSGNTVSIVPTCQANTGGAGLGSGGWNDCSLVDVSVVNVTPKYGRFLVAWEDSHWGNDYDMDGIASIEYCTATGSAAAVQTSCPTPAHPDEGISRQDWAAASTGEVQIRVSVPQANAGNALRFGFIMNGSIGLDGSYSQLLRPGNSIDVDCDGNPGLEEKGRILQLNGANTGCVRWDSTRMFAASPGTGQLLENPLHYAAKYGNFNDQDGDGTPGFDGDNDGSPDVGDNREWDVEDVNGNPTPDGIPDSFFPVRNPANLEAGLGRVFNAITARVASGTAAAVVANNTSGDGAVYQALYNPFFEDANNNRVEWVGMLQGIFIDKDGNLREDGNSNAILDADCSVDPIVEIFFDSTISETKLKRFPSSGCNKTVSTIHQLADLKPIWNARDQLATLADPTLQRVYTTKINSASTMGGRYIFTSSDGGRGNEIDFDTTAINATMARYFNVATEAEADNITNFIRGEEGLAGFRSRTVDYDSDNVNEIWRLGDIVHSTPVVAGIPGDNYETIYGDKSYATFKAAYYNRRQVVYVGANDGMIHAFNGGFFDQAAKGFKLKNTSEVEHPLGAELWAYVPYNLLPHLKWLTKPGYEHTYYVDGEPRLYDVNIFTPDATHVEGWGTILVVGMRFGGAPITVDSDGNGTVGNAGDKTLRSAYVVLDVTDPESPPVLLGELSDPNMGFTVGVPALVKARSEVAGSGFTNASVDSWNLLVGSGPDDLATATSTKTAKLFGYNLSELNGGTGGSVANFAPLTGSMATPGIFDLSIANSFVGGLRSTDWDREYSDDAVYFGISGGTAAASTGTVMRQRLDTTSVQYAELVTGLSQSFVSTPDVLLDSKSQQWVLAGTGRLYVTADQKTVEQQGFYGFKDPLDVPASKVTSIPTPSALTKSQLLDTTGVQVFKNNDVLKGGAAYSIGATPINKFSELVGQVDTNFSGWYNNFQALGAGSPSERNVSASTHVSNLVLYTSFDPGSQNSCDAGTSFLNVRHFNTGTAAPFAPIGTNSTIQRNSADLSYERKTLGSGLYSAPVLHRGSGGITVITQGSTGAIGGDNVTLEGVLAGRQSWRQIYDF